MDKFKLSIELVPKGAWINNLRTTLSKDNWDKIRDVCYQKSNGFC